MPNLTINFKKLPHGKDMPTPQRASELASGMDVYAAINKDIILQPGHRTLIPTGIQLDIPEGFECQARPRSGLAINNGITLINSPGTIDADYRGEIKIALINHGKEKFVISRNMRIAQIIFCPITKVTLQESQQLSKTQRGESGFGSTGL